MKNQNTKRDNNINMYLSLEYWILAEIILSNFIWIRLTDSHSNSKVLRKSNSKLENSNQKLISILQSIRLCKQSL